MINVLDILVLGVLVAGLVKGWMSGFFRQVVSFSGFFVGLLAAFLFYSVVGDWLAPFVGGNVSVCRAAAFVLVWIGVPLALSMLAHVLTRVARHVKLGGVNRLGGSCLCALKYMVFLSCVLNVCAIIHLLPPALVGNSRLHAPVCAISGKMFEVCTPHVVRAVDGIRSISTNISATDR